MTDQDNTASPENTTQKTQPDAGTALGRTLENAVRTYAEATGAEIREREAWPGSLIKVRYAEPAAGMRAALIARDTASRVIRDYGRRAREDGLSWEAIGQALALDQGQDAPDGYELGAAAYEAMAGAGDPWYEPSFAWTCSSCTSTISDRGPYDSHPADREQGHAGGCQRLAADMTVHRRRTAGWDAEAEAEQASQADTEAQAARTAATKQAWADYQAAQAAADAARAISMDIDTDAGMNAGLLRIEAEGAYDDYSVAWFRERYPQAQLDETEAKNREARE
jgi:hypothetical protein